MKKPNSTSLPAASTKIKFEDEDSIHSSSDEEEEEEDDVTFEELQKARSDGTDFVVKKAASQNKTGRANKNRPMEMSAKKPVSRFREIIQVPKKVRCFFGVFTTFATIQALILGIDFYEH